MTGSPGRALRSGIPALLKVTGEHTVRRQHLRSTRWLRGRASVGTSAPASGTGSSKRGSVCFVAVARTDGDSLTGTQHPRDAATSYFSGDSVATSIYSFFNIFFFIGFYR